MQPDFKVQQLQIGMKAILILFRIDLIPVGEDIDRIALLIGYHRIEEHKMPVMLAAQDHTPGIRRACPKGKAVRCADGSEGFQK